MTDIHSCSYYCERPECIKAQRDELRDRLAQPNDFNPDWDAMAVMVEEQQRMAKRIDELEAQQKPWVKTYSGGQPNYTVPEEQAQPRQWQGLTDEEIKEIIGPWGETPIKGYTRKLFDLIEAKLKEKNHG